MAKREAIRLAADICRTIGVGPLGKRRYGAMDRKGLDEALRRWERKRKAARA